MFAVAPQIHVLFTTPAASAKDLHPSLSSFVEGATSFFMFLQCISFVAVDQLESSVQKPYANIILSVKNIIVPRKIANPVLNV